MSTRITIHDPDPEGITGDFFPANGKTHYFYGINLEDGVDVFLRDSRAALALKDEATQAYNELLKQEAVDESDHK